MRQKIGRNPTIFSTLQENWFFWLFSLVIVLLLMYVGYFFLTHERVVSHLDYQIKQEAMNNRFYLAQLLLEKNGKEVYSENGKIASQQLKQVWQQSTEQAKKTAIILYDVTKSQERQIPQMLSWVRKGGHIITFSKNTLYYQKDNDLKNQQLSYEMYENFLLTQLGIVNKEFPINSSKEESTVKTPIHLTDKVLMYLPDVKNPANQGIGVLLSSTVNAQFQLDDEKFWQRFPDAKKIADYRWLIWQKDSITLRDTRNAMTNSQKQQLIDLINVKPKAYIPPEQVMFDVSLGQGRITVFQDNLVFTNPSNIYLSKKQTSDKLTENQYTWQVLTNHLDYPNNITNLDNAYILQYLLQDRNQIWLIPHVEVPNLLTLLWSSLKWACVAFLLCILMGLLAIPKRFGRIRRYQTDSGRNIFQYFNKIGQYLWFTDKAKALVTENRHYLLEKIIVKHPYLVTEIEQFVEPQVICQTVADEMNIGNHTVYQALFADWHNAQQFWQITRQFVQLNRFYGK